MARNNDRDRKRAIKDTRPRGKKRVCIFCMDHSQWIDYKDVNLLRRFMTMRGSLRSRRQSHAGDRDPLRARILGKK